MEKLGWHSLGTEFDCDCGLTHRLPIEACYVGDLAAEELAEFAHGRCGGGRALVVSDETTRALAGDKVLSLLGMRHTDITEQVFPADDLEATQELADQVAEAGRDCDFYVAIGSGTLSDLAKDAGSKQDKPVLLYPTAASMNGYTSAIVALKVRGLKRTLPCKPATGIFADPAIAATAPQRMTAAGVADFLSKCSSAADWRAAHILRGEYYCHRPREFNEGIQERLFQQAEAVGRGEPEAVRLVMEALLLSGFGMVLAGSSAPASGGEHLLSHYLDMKHALYGTGNDFHGTQVGVGTIYTLGLWEKILALRSDDIDIEDCIASQPAQEQVREWVFSDWGDQVGEEVWAQWNQKLLSPDQLRSELQLFQQELPRLREELMQDLQPAAVVARCIEQCRGPATPEGVHAPVEEFEKAKRYSRFLRNRFTVLDLAAELNITP